MDASRWDVLKVHKLAGYQAMYLLLRSERLSTARHRTCSAIRDPFFSLQTEHEHMLKEPHRYSSFAGRLCDLHPARTGP